MGTKVHFESRFPGYFSMKDISEDSNGCSWPLNYGDKTFANGQYYNGFFPRAIADAYPGHDKDVVKQQMLEHEAIFKDQLYELHRLYKIQRDLMEEIKRKELHKNQIPIEVSLSSSPLASQITSEDARKWHIPSLPLENSFCARQSTSGIEDIHSPLSSMKRSSLQGGPLPSQNGCISKDMEILESRPTKVRKRMFDLRLPADEYIDNEETEHLRDDKLSGSSSYLSNKNHKIVLDCRRNLLPVDVHKSNFQGDALRSDSFLRSKNGVTDLNEPVEAEEINASAYVDLLGCNSSNGQIQKQEVAAKSKSQLLGFSRSIPLNAHHGSENGTMHNTASQINTNGKWFSPQMIDAVNSNHLKSTPQGLLREKLAPSSEPMQLMFHKTYESPNFVQSGQGKVDQLQERMVHGPELSERNHEVCNSSHPESFVISHNSSYLIAAPNLGKSWSNSVSSWEKSSGILSQRSMSAQTQAYLSSSATLSSSQSSNQSHEVYGDRWNYNSSSAFNPIFQSEMPIRNGFYHGSSSGSKELLARLPPGNCDYLNGSAANSSASEHFVNQGSAKFCKSLNCMDLNTAEDVSLNAVPSNCSSNKQTLQPGFAIIDIEKKHEDKPATLPWLRARPACKNKFTNARVDLNTGEISSLKSSLSHFFTASETERVTNRIVTQNMKSNSCSDAVETCSAEMSQSSSCRKILGFPIFQKPHVFKKESSSFTSPSVSHPQPSEEVDNKREVKVLDINLPCDPAFLPDLGQHTVAEAIEKETDAKVANMRHEFDLNSFMSEDEASPMPSVPDFNLKIVSGIDLEAPIDLETEEDLIPGKECPEKVHEVPLVLPQCKAESLQDEVVMMAAEAMVAISTSGAYFLLSDATCNGSESSITDPLHWFVDIASSYGEDLENRFDKASRGKDGEEKDRSSPEAIDYFESMALNLTETKEEDYMPKPMVPENLNLEDAGNTPLPTRKARRGRQRRDFQRDILPGLASLSRHEVTEDLQTFGGLMRATGHPWHSGLMRRNSTRNGGARGRRHSRISPSPPVTALPPCTPLIQQLNNVEVGLDDRSLAGWGKTTRRPRRQRCPAGNPQPVLLT